MENKNITIVVDSGSDLLMEEAQQLGVVLLPLTIRFGDEQFSDGVDITRDEFYDRLADKEVPKTSLIPPAVYEEVFKEETEKGNEVICLCLSSKLSGCYQSAMLAKEDYEDKVYVVDTLEVCAPEYILAMRAVQLRSEGLSAKEIVDVLEQEKHKVKVIAVFDTLEYLLLGGRLSKVSAVAGEILSIKPVITVDEGEINVLAKARGRKNGSQKLIDILKEDGIDWTKPVILSYTGKSIEYLNQFREKAGDILKDHLEDIIISRVGATIGTYAGPDAYAISYYPNN